MNSTIRKLPAWEASRDVNALSAQVTGNGVMAVESFDIWNEWFQTAAARNCQIELDDPALGHWEGQFILASLKYGGARGQKVTVDITLDNTGIVTWVPLTPLAARDGEAETRQGGLSHAVQRQSDGEAVQDRHA